METTKFTEERSLLRCVRPRPTPRWRKFVGRWEYAKRPFPIGLALSWVLEIGDPTRFHSSRDAISNCGLCSAQRESAGKEQRGPLSKKRNKHLQTMLIEAAKLVPRWNAQLAELHEKELAKGNRNRATLAVALKLVEYLLAVDRRGTAFVER